MSPDELDVALEELETRVERLRALYEQYFIGIEKVEPLVARKDVDRRIWLLRREQIRNTGKRFRLQTTIQRYNTFQQYWMRICREIENGTYARHLLKAQKLAAESEMLTIAARKRYRHRHTQEDHGPEGRDSGGLDRLRLLDDELADALDALDPLCDTGPREALEPSLGTDAYAPRRSPEEIRRAMDDVLGPSVPPPPLAPPPRTTLDPARRKSGEPAAGGRSLPPVPRPPPGASLSRAPKPDPSPAAEVPLPGPAPKGPPPPLKGGPAAPSLRAGPTRHGPLATAAPVGTPPTVRSPGPPPGSPAVSRTSVAGSARIGQSQLNASGSSITDQRASELHARFVAARQQTHENSSVSLESLKRTLAATEAKLRAQHGAARRIDFDVVIKDGKAALKPIVR